MGGGGDLVQDDCIGEGSELALDWYRGWDDASVGDWGIWLSLFWSRLWDIRRWITVKRVGKGLWICFVRSYEPVLG